MWVITLRTSNVVRLEALRRGTGRVGKLWIAMVVTTKLHHGVVKAILRKQWDARLLPNPRRVLQSTSIYLSPTNPYCVLHTCSCSTSSYVIGLWVVRTKLCFLIVWAWSLADPNLTFRPINRRRLGWITTASGYKRIGWLHLYTFRCSWWCPVNYLDNLIYLENIFDIGR